MSAKLEFDFKSAIFNTGLVQPVESSIKGGKINVLCRQIPSQEAPWVQLLPKLLKAAEDGGFDLHLCRKYVLRNGKMVYGWHLAVDTKKAADLEPCLNILKGVLEKAKPVLNKVLAPGQHPAKHANKDPLGAAYQAGPDFKKQVKKGPLPGRIQYNFDNFNGKVDYAPMGTHSDTDNPVAVVESRKMTKDRRGRTIVEEVIAVPIPHIRTNDMNKPNENGGGVLNPLYDVPKILQSGSKSGKVG